MAVEGVRVDVVYTEDDVALRFSTVTGDVADLRRRARGLAGMYRTRSPRRPWKGHGARPEGAGGVRPPADGRAPPSGLEPRGPLPPAEISTDDIERGARIVFRPKDPTQLDALRIRIRHHRQRMASGTCLRGDPP